MLWHGIASGLDQYSEEELDASIGYMKEMGLNCIRMGEFHWFRFEPEEGVYDFAWMDRIIDKLGKAGIYTMICTPTACPPVWMVEKHPEILFTDNRGIKRPFGARRHYCYASPVYRDYARKIARAMAMHYGDNPYVMGWQINNELGNEATGRCYCDYCKGRFIQWLKDKYHTIDTLNRAWGTFVWGAWYTDFNQIRPPVLSIDKVQQPHIRMYVDSPSLRINWENFCSEMNAESSDIEAEEIRKYAKNQEITTNTAPLNENYIDYYKQFKTLDEYAIDYFTQMSYLNDSREDQGIYGLSFIYAYSRNVKKGKNSFWIPEFATGAGGQSCWSAKGGEPHSWPGALQARTIHGFASGATQLLHAGLITLEYGAEHLSSGLVGTDRVKKRFFYEVKEAAKQVKELSGLLENSEIRNEVAICIDYNVIWGFRIKPVHYAFDYVEEVRQMYVNLLKAGISADVVPYDEGINRYKLVIIPTPLLLDDTFKETVKAYVSGGGTVMTTYLAGLKNSENVGRANEFLPGGLSDVFCVRVDESEVVYDKQTTDIILKLKDREYTGKNSIWTEILESRGAEMIGVYADTFRKGRGVVSKYRFGEGTAYYIGTEMEDEMFRALALEAAKEQGIEKTPIEIRSGLEVVTRQTEDRKIYFVFNFTEQDKTVILNERYQNIQTGEACADTLVLGPHGYAILEREKS